MNLEEKRNPRLLTVKEVAAMCGVSGSHIYRMTDRGAMPKPVKLGSASRYRRDEINHWIASGCPNLSKSMKGRN